MKVVMHVCEEFYMYQLTLYVFVEGKTFRLISVLLKNY